ncbi:geranylgeranyl pyrophosphate synthetase [Penicillium herquei]|nr:geranylgeranyl pyrophosphate synthetase [Penicillium herquei]
MLRVSSGRSRSRYRGARGGWLGMGHHRNRQQSVAESPAPPQGPLLVEIERHELERSQECPQITSCEYLSSYTWLDRASPSILVPGEPPLWNPVVEDRQLKPDRGDYFRDPNAARYPSYLWEASFEAISRQNPEYNLNNTGIVTCSSTLGNLMRFARGVEKDFRFIMETVGNTVLFSRRENSPTDLIPDVRGYGHTFLDEYTTWGLGLAGSESHQRIIQYDFGGLHLILRFESDGYIQRERQDGMPFHNQDETSTTSSRDAEACIDSLIVRLQGDHDPDPADHSGKLKSDEAGRPIAQSDVIDIKTRSMIDFKTRAVKKEIDMTDLTPRLWVSQIPTLVVAYHERGLFKDIRVQDMRDEIMRWERDNEEVLRRLAWLLNELLHYAKSSMTRLEVCRSGAGPIQIRRLAGEAPLALSPEMKARWTGKDSHQSSENEGVSSYEDDHDSPRFNSSLSDSDSDQG